MNKYILFSSSFHFLAQIEFLVYNFTYFKNDNCELYCLLFKTKESPFHYTVFLINKVFKSKLLSQSFHEELNRKNDSLGGSSMFANDFQFLH